MLKKLVMCLVFIIVHFAVVIGMIELVNLLGDMGIGGSSAKMNLDVIYEIFK